MVAVVGVGLGVEVWVGRGVEVRLKVLVGVKLNVEVWVGVGVRLGVPVGVKLEVGVEVKTGEFVAVAVGGWGVSVKLKVGVAAGGGVSVEVGVKEGVQGAAGVSVTVGVLVGADGLVGARVGIARGVSVEVGGVRVPVASGVSVAVPVGEAPEIGMITDTLMGLLQAQGSDIKRQMPTVVHPAGRFMGPSLQNSRSTSPSNGVEPGGSNRFNPHGRKIAVDFKGCPGTTVAPHLSEIHIQQFQSQKTIPSLDAG